MRNLGPPIFKLGLARHPFNLCYSTVTRAWHPLFSPLARRLTAGPAPVASSSATEILKNVSASDAELSVICSVAANQLAAVCLVVVAWSSSLPRDGISQQSASKSRPSKTPGRLLDTYYASAHPRCAGSHDNSAEIVLPFLQLRNSADEMVARTYPTAVNRCWGRF
jgi:hypothetical protein